MDLLSEVLSVLKLTSSVARGFDLAGDWAVRFPRHEGIKCYAVLRGRCRMVMEGVEEPLEVEAGDCLLMPHGRAFVLESGPGVPAVEWSAMEGVVMEDEVWRLHGGNGVLGLGGYFAFEGGAAALLLRELPPVVHLRSGPERAAMRWSLERIREELMEQRPGSALMVRQMATAMLVQALRLHLEERATARTGWLAALVDEPIEGAMQSMHGDPARRWTLDALAMRSGMSRSVFAERFKATVGTSAMLYLLRWRMLLAGERLRDGEEAVAAVARSLGYESESAFSKAFRRVMGCSPRQYRRGHEGVAGVEAHGPSEVLRSA